jgi:acetyl esterase/lipase
LPVYVYFHGGGWTSGDKAALTKYCASQSVDGIVVVNANYRRARRAHMGQILEDASRVLTWVQENIASFGGDPGSLVLGGDSAGGQIAALLTAASFQPELAEHHAMTVVPARGSVKGLVQHCSIVDFSVLFERSSVLSLDFVRMLVPRHRRRTDISGRRARGQAWLRREARFLSPIEWLAPGFPPVLVTTSERDYFYRANLNFLERLRAHAIPVETLIYDRSVRNAVHTWQQNARHDESQEVYRRLHQFVRMATGIGSPVSSVV